MGFSLCASTDILKFKDINADDVELTYSGKDLLISIKSSGEAITIYEQFYSTSSFYGIEQIEFADGTIWDRATIRDEAFTIRGDDEANDLIGATSEIDETFVGNKGDDTLLGGKGSDVYVYSLGDGNDEITEIGSSSDTDILKLTDINSTDVKLTRSLIGGDDLFVTVTSTGETIKVVGHFISSAAGLEKIVFSDGSTWARDTILSNSVFQGTDLANTIVGSDEDDLLVGGGGYGLLNGGTGNDTIIDGPNDGTTDTLVLEDILPDDVALVRNGNDVTLVISESSEGAGDGGAILLKANLEDFYNRGVDLISFSDGSEWTQSDMRQMLLTNTSADESFTGFSSNDTFVFSDGDGNDTIYDFEAGEGSDDVINFSNIVSLTDFASVLAVAADQDGDTLITIDTDNSILLKDVSVSDLHQDDFRFV
nr:calcium-binding protein [uncultured Cohaesibacter sp.]